MKHFVMSDIHGMGELFDEVMDFLSDFDEYQLIFLGDACDRGPDGYRIMRELLANPNVVYLKGNHEDMFVKAARQVMAMAMDENLSILELIKCYGGVEDLMRFSGEDSRLYIQNGGLPTFREWIKDGARKSFVNEIASLPIYHCLNDHIDMFHAGSNTSALATMDKEDMLWDRDHFCDKWMYGEGDRLLIHGHTPVEHIYFYIEEEVPRIWQPMRYSENKICMDTAAFMTNTIGLYYVENDCFVMFSPEEQLPTF